MLEFLISFVSFGADVMAMGNSGKDGEHMCEFNMALCLSLTQVSQMKNLTETDLRYGLRPGLYYHICEIQCSFIDCWHQWQQQQSLQNKFFKNKQQTLGVRLF